MPGALLVMDYEWAWDSAALSLRERTRYIPREQVTLLLEQGLVKMHMSNSAVLTTPDLTLAQAEELSAVLLALRMKGGA
jgi:hypothetical protein